MKQTHVAMFMTKLSDVIHYSRAYISSPTWGLERYDRRSCTRITRRQSCWKTEKEITGLRWRSLSLYSGPFKRGTLDILGLPSETTCRSSPTLFQQQDTNYVSTNGIFNKVWAPQASLILLRENFNPRSYRNCTLDTDFLVIAELPPVTTSYHAA
jgi:hypothetical protein